MPWIFGSHVWAPAAERLQAMITWEGARKKNMDMVMDSWGDRRRVQECMWLLSPFIWHHRKVYVNSSMSDPLDWQKVVIMHKQTSAHDLRLYKYSCLGGYNVERKQNKDKHTTQVLIIFFF